MIRLIIYIVLIILVLSFFGVSLESLINSPVTHQNFAYLWQLVVQGWDNFLVAIHLASAQGSK